MFSFCGFSYNSTMYEHVVNYSPVLQYCKLSTAQRNQPAQSHNASTCRSECASNTQRAPTVSVPQAQHSTAQSARTKPQSKYADQSVKARKQT